MKKHIIEGEQYQEIEVSKPFLITDSFVARTNKIGSGSGEAKLYFPGSQSAEFREFFGSKPFKLRCFFEKSDLLQLLDDLEPEYNKPIQSVIPTKGKKKGEKTTYRNREELPNLFKERKSQIEKEEDIIWFWLKEKTESEWGGQLQHSGLYAHSQDDVYNYLRELPLPNLCYLYFFKLEEISTGSKTIFRVMLSADLSQIPEHSQLTENPTSTQNLVKASSEAIHEAESYTIQKIRKGQPKFRRIVLESCNYCPITKVNDRRILLAAHIKPYSVSTAEEKYDEFNGIALTPTMHDLFDQGLIAVNQKQTLIVSESIPKITMRNLGLEDNLKLQIPGFDKRKKYFKWHQENIFDKSE